MGALLSSHITSMTMTSMLTDLQNALKRITDKRQYLTMSTMQLSIQKSSIFEQAGLNGNKQAEYQAKALEQKEKVLEQMDKMLEMQQKNIETQIKITEQRQQAAQKQEESCIKFAFGGGNGQ